MSDSVRHHRWQPTRLPSPWDSPGKNTGVGCHFLLQWMKVKSESEVAQSCPTLSVPMDCSPSGSPIPGILQTRILEWVAISFSNAWKWKVKSLCRVRLLATPWTAAYQAPPSMGFFRQEYWNGVLLLYARPWWVSGKESACNAGDLSSILGLGRSPGEENGNPFQYSCLENSIESRALWATVHRVAQSYM